MDFDTFFAVGKSNTRFTYSCTTTTCVYRADGKREVTVEHREVQGANGKVKAEKNQKQHLLLDTSGKKAKAIKAKAHGGKKTILAIKDGS